MGNESSKFTKYFGMVILAAITGFGTAVGTNGFGLIKNSIVLFAPDKPFEIQHLTAQTGSEIAAELSRIDANPDPRKIWGSISAAHDIHVWFVDRKDSRENWEYEYLAEPYDSSSPENIPAHLTSADRIVPLGFGSSGGRTVIAYLKAHQE